MGGDCGESRSVKGESESWTECGHSYSEIRCFLALVLAIVVHLQKIGIQNELNSFA